MNLREAYLAAQLAADQSSSESVAAVNASTLGYTAKNLMQLSDFSDTKNGFKYPKMRVLKPGKYILSCKVNTIGNNPQEWRWKNAEGTVIKSVRTKNSAPEISFEFELTETAESMDVYFNSGGDYSDFMLRDARITDAAFEPYRPTVDERLTALENAAAAAVNETEANI